LGMISLSASSKSNTAAVVMRIQQNTFSIIIYLLIAIFIYPAKPLQALREQRCRVYDALAAAAQDVMACFSPHIANDPEGCKTVLKAAKASVGKLRPLLAAEQQLLQPAEDEPILHFATYPMEANRTMTRSEEQLVGVLETCVQAWEFLYNTKDTSSPDWYNLVVSLSPIAQDVGQGFAASLNALKVVVLDPYAKDTVRDQVEQTVQFHRLARELLDRMTRGSVFVIQAAQKRNELVECALEPPESDIRIMQHDEDHPIGYRHAMGIRTICFCASLLFPALRQLQIAAAEMHQFDAQIS